jgi:hypothetical protein
LIGIFTLVVDAYGQGCSQCKLLSKQGAALDEASFGTNINWGILYLMVIPYLLLMLFFRKKIISFFKTKMQKNKK